MPLSFLINQLYECSSPICSKNIVESGPLRVPTMRMGVQIAWHNDFGGTQDIPLKSDRWQSRQDMFSLRFDASPFPLVYVLEFLGPRVPYFNLASQKSRILRPVIQLHSSSCLTCLTISLNNFGKHTPNDHKKARNAKKSYGSLPKRKTKTYLFSRKSRGNRQFWAHSWGKIHLHYSPTGLPGRRNIQASTSLPNSQVFHCPPSDWQLLR